MRGRFHTFKARAPAITRHDVKHRQGDNRRKRSIDSTVSHASIR
jgi:hypothetical protein